MKSSILNITDSQQLLIGGYVVRDSKDNKQAYIFVEEFKAVVGGVETTIGVVECWALESTWSKFIEAGKDGVLDMKLDHETGRWSDFDDFKDAMGQLSITDYVECRCITRRF